MLKAFTNRKAIPLRGGMTTVRDAVLLPSGSFSAITNMRPTHPGFIKRPGQSALNATADQSGEPLANNAVLSLYQYVKKQPTGIAPIVFAQMSDSDILQSDTPNLPPTASTGVFGTQVFDGTTSPRPASWSVVDDILVMSNGVDQHQVHVGAAHYPKCVVVYSDDATIVNIPVEGTDGTKKVTDGDTDTYITLNIGEDADHGILICCPTRANRLTFTVKTINENASAATVKYREDDGKWTAVSDLSDGTEDAGGTKTLGKTGAGVMYWTLPTDEIPWFMYGHCGYWYYVSFNAALTAATAVSIITYGTDHDGSGERRTFLDAENVWDGVAVDAIEALVEMSEFYTYGSYTIDVGGAALDNTGALYISSFDPLCGIFLDPSSTPNTAAATLTSVSYWNGTAWAALSNVSDGTLANSKTIASPGWITWSRPAAGAEHPLHFQSTQYYAYWYKLVVSAAISTDIILSAQTMPYFDITDWGKGVTNCAWQDRMCYASDRWGQYVYISKLGHPLTLNGADYGVLEAGDGRSNQVLAMNTFFNEIIVWQEERGMNGGCTTLFEGYSPATFGKLVLSNRVGILNANCHVVVDGVLTSTATEEKIKTLAFWLSRYGVCVSDGRSVAIISDNIQDYFDPTKSTCIKDGQEEQHWLAYDSTFNLIRIGLASGSTATVPNKFFCFDLVDKCWYEDSLGQALRCCTEMEAQTGNVTVLQVGGGASDGKVHLLNTTNLDGSATTMTSTMTMEFNGAGDYLALNEFVLRNKAVDDNTLALQIYANDVLQVTETLDLSAEDTGQAVRRNLLSLNVIDPWVTVKLTHSTANKTLTLYDVGLQMEIWVGR